MNKHLPVVILLTLISLTAVSAPDANDIWKHYVETRALANFNNLKATYTEQYADPGEANQKIESRVNVMSSGNKWHIREELGRVESGKSYFCTSWDGETFVSQSGRYDAHGNEVDDNLFVIDGGGTQKKSSGEVMKLVKQLDLNTDRNRLDLLQVLDFDAKNGFISVGVPGQVFYRFHFLNLKTLQYDQLEFYAEGRIVAKKEVNSWFKIGGTQFPASGIHHYERGADIAFSVESVETTPPEASEDFKIDIPYRDGVLVQDNRFRSTVPVTELSKELMTEKQYLRAFDARHIMKETGIAPLEKAELLSLINNEAGLTNERISEPSPGITDKNKEQKKVEDRPKTNTFVLTDYILVVAVFILLGVIAYKTLPIFKKGKSADENLS
jgi:hypothetical protein